MTFTRRSRSPYKIIYIYARREKNRVARNGMLLAATQRRKRCRQPFSFELIAKTTRNSVERKIFSQFAIACCQKMQKNTKFSRQHSFAHEIKSSFRLHRDFFVFERRENRKLDTAIYHNWKPEIHDNNLCWNSGECTVASRNGDAEWPSVTSNESTRCWIF